MSRLERTDVLVEDGELNTVTLNAKERNCREEFKGNLHQLKESEMIIRILLPS